jgi:hypothetical protein
MEAHLRVHTEYISLANLISYTDKYCTKVYLVKEEDATRPHYQGYVRFDQKYQNLESLRNLLKKHLTQKGNRVYSISLARESMQRHIAYLMKEGQEPLVQKNISILDLKAAKDLVTDFKKRQSMTTMEKLADSYSGDDSVERIAKYIMEEWKRQGRMLPDPRLMKRYIQTIQFIKWPEVHQARYLQEVAQLFSW